MQKDTGGYRMFLVFSMDRTLSGMPHVEKQPGVVFAIKQFCWFSYVAYANYSKQSLISSEVYIVDKMEAFWRRKNMLQGTAGYPFFLLALHRIRSAANSVNGSSFKNGKKLVPQYREFLQACIDEFADMASTHMVQAIPSNTQLNAFGSKEDHSEGIDVLYKKLFHELSIPIVLLDGSLSVVNYNKASEGVFEKVCNRLKLLDSELLSPETRKILSHHIAIMHRQSQEQVNFDTYLETSHGNRFYRVILKQIHFPQIRFHGLMMMFDDLSNRKKIEQHLEVARQKAEEADRLKTAFLANMSHEIRTPMNAIIGFSDMLITSQPTREESDEYLHLIKRSGNDLLNIIDDIIDIAKIEAKQLKVRMVVTNPYNILADIKKIYDKTIHERGKDVRLKLEVSSEEKDSTFNTDPERLKQVIRNLTSNAVKFTEYGEITIGYKIDNDKIRFFVRDTGVGIPSTMLNKIFDRFVQADNRYEMNTNGTGLGLTISRSIVQLLGGEIEVSSILNEGSNFNFWLPYIEAEPLREVVLIRQSKPKAMANSGINLLTKTILVAEDEESNFFYLNELLRKTGAHIIWAKNGLEAINYVEQSQNIDIILMDIKMPEISGLDAIKYVHRIKPQIPIIAQTAFASAKDRQVCLSAGCVDYITKPLNRTLLFSLLEKHLPKATKKQLHV